TPVVGAEVQIRPSGIPPFTVRTGPDGSAPVRFQAPAYAAGDVVSQQVVAEAQHPAYGSALATAAYVLSRVPWRVEIRAEGGAVVPETNAEAFVLVTDPLGAPAPENTVITVRGAVVRGGSARLTLDEHGLARLPISADAGLASPMRTGACANRTAASVEIEWASSDLVATSCVPIAADARVRIATSQPIYAPGSAIDVQVQRRPSVRGRTVLVEALAGGRVVAATFAQGARARLEMPAGTIGRVVLRARPFGPTDRTADAASRGNAAFEPGSSTAVLLRPADAFEATLRPGRDRYAVRDRATVGLELSQAPQRAWAAYVVRDLAAHGGEGPWRTDWLSAALTEAAESGGLLLEAAFAAELTPDVRPYEPEPLVPPPWGAGPQGYRRSAYDAVVMRGEMLTRGAGQLMTAIERAAASMIQQGKLEEIAQRGRFLPNAIDTMIEAGVMNDAQAKTLGDRRATIAMLRAVQPSLSFRTVAERLARQRLVTLLAAVLRFSNPDDEGAARASSGFAPEDWLSRMVERGLITTDQLRDPWGRAFTLRRDSSPRFVLSTRAIGYELVSAGADGRFGSADDIDDPFARVIPESTPYSVASGEDGLMRRLSMLAPGARTLSAMAESYASLDLRAREESRARAVRSRASEGADGFAAGAVLGGLEGDELGESYGVGGLGLQGTGRGGGGEGYGRGSGRIARRARPSSMAAFADAEMEMPMEEAAAPEPSRDRNESRLQQTAPVSAFNQMAQVVRERFPATLHFESIVPLDGDRTNLVVPLQDALTTYRLEAIVWSASGWLTTAKTEIRVDQDATIDGPVPPFAAVGDTLQLPVRVENRTAGRLRLFVRAVAEDIALGVPEPVAVEVDGRDAEEVLVAVQAPSAGTGHVRLDVVREDGTPLDSIRRPVTVWPDAAVIRQRMLLLAEPGERIEYEVPSDATPRGSATLQLSPASLLFGDPLEYAAGSVAAGWVAALVGEAPDADALRAAKRLLRASDSREQISITDSVDTAMALALVWNDDSVPDAVIARALRGLGQSATREGPSQPPMVNAAAARFAALRPAIASEARPAQQENLATLVEGLRSRTRDAVAHEDLPALWARAAFALALNGETVRSRELLRRAGRFVIRIGDEAFLENRALYGQFEGRIKASAWIAGAYAALGERAAALPFLRHLATASNPDQWPTESRLQASAVAHLIAGGRPESVRLELDGRTIELDQNSGLFVAESAEAATPGSHALTVNAGSAPSLVFLRFRYGRPWAGPWEAPLAVDLEVDGDLGARDRRSGLAIEVRNRQPRLLSQPVVSLDLPAGAELDEDARVMLRGLTRGEPTLEGRTLRLELRPLPPGATLRIPLPIRWSVGGQLHGLGATLVDERDRASRIAVLPSRVVDIADRGAVPDVAEADRSEPDPPPPPEPIRPLLESLDPYACSGASSVRTGSFA
ncbi:MAG: alpha-2-macroglobulin family protein, partial [Myxococcota bacterium]